MGKMLEKIVVNLPGWIFVIAGMSILSMALLVPAYIDSQQLAWQHDLLKLQNKRWSEQEENYRQFAKAIETHDPVVLQRLAVHQLRLKPVGTALVDPPLVAATQTPRPGPQRTVPITTVRNNGKGGVYATTAMVPMPTPAVPTAPIIPTIESMLRRPIPVAGVTYPEYEPLPSRVVRITTGKLRWPFVASGFLLLVAGLLAKTREDLGNEVEAEASAAETQATEPTVSEPAASPDAPPTHAVAEPEAIAPAPAPVTAATSAAVGETVAATDAASAPVENAAPAATPALHPVSQALIEPAPADPIAEPIDETPATPAPVARPTLPNA